MEKLKEVKQFDKHKSAIPLFIREMESDLKQLKKSLSQKHYELAVHYSSGINQLTKSITDILKLHNEGI